ncbi:sigma-54-dependent Fis family transcriptional regulator, partial [bacterium]|nr:sigma-54-dependent Fis family transcriptional regulator [bacterium]
MNLNKILVVEDNETMRIGMVETLKREGFKVSEFSNVPQAIEFFKKCQVPLVISDLKMEPIDGMEFLKQVKEIQPKTEVLMISAFGTVQTAVNAMQLGAADFLTKPFSTDELRVRVRKVMNKIQKDEKLDNLKAENSLLQNELFAGQIIGNSPQMQKVFELIECVAKSDSSVLIEGESGTGKELVARAIHQKSNRAEEPFIKVNCGALNDNLLESELFGHEKGSFTNAIRQKKGRFELANKGTIFMDEIGDVSPVMQVSLLRVLQEGQFERVGGEETISVDVRIVSATHRNCQKMIAENKFREDLFYRLNVIPIKLPALRERKSDIPLLAEHFLNKFAEKRKLEPKKISNEGMKLLENYTWFGNIRELENLVERLNV